MTFTYSGDPSEDEISALRFKLADTNKDAALFTDEELQYLIDEYGENEDILTYQVFSYAATKFARDIKRSLGPQSEDPTSRLAYFREKANAAKKRLVSKGLYLPKYQAPKQFWKGMMDNPPAGLGD